MVGNAQTLFSRLESLKNTLTLYSKKRYIKVGLPFILFVVGGSFALREWTQIRYQFSTVKSVSKEELEKMGLHKTKEVTLEKTYEEIQKLDIDNWENKRGPRPWEMDGKEMK